nr:immunoglobulin heavy chain junction region [Macaca mulatta]MOW45702.1 immunoglobulin heavy chain junction region [Macaca mulatta]MOW48425.1 immunoglobulin heavy chain junction region [Macaca mulatta]MOW49351.1 immunoglobulin heavy chain junction region [Macaca mulatta]MOW50444.1 immunoglobulin heavy chain junction region [Macaca mulatta]
CARAGSSVYYDFDLW